MTIYALDGIEPDLAQDCWIAPSADVMGKVTVGPRASVWFGAAIRGDNEMITVGTGSNVQENSVLHTDIGYPLTIGENCTIGHKVMLHGCTIGDNSLIGMGAIVLNGAVIGKNCLVGAGALITENKVIPDGSMVLGMPGKVVKKLTQSDTDGLRASATWYQETAARFRNGLKPLN